MPLGRVSWVPAAERVIAEREVVRLEIVQTAQTVERVVVVVRRTVLRVGHARPVGGGIIAVLHREGARRQEGIGGARLGQPVHVVIGEAVGAGWVLNLGQPAQRAQEMAIRIALGSQRSGMLAWSLPPPPNLPLVAASWDCLAPLRPRICCSRFC